MIRPDKNLGDHPDIERAMKTSDSNEVEEDRLAPDTFEDTAAYDFAIDNAMIWDGD